MFTLEVLTEEAEKLLQQWRDNGVDLRNFGVVTQEDYNHIRCLVNYFDCDRDTFDKVNTPLQRFIRNNKSPFILESDELMPCTSAYNKDFKHVRLMENLIEYSPFEWPEQIMRYRAAMLLEATE